MIDPQPLHLALTGVQLIGEHAARGPARPTKGIVTLLANGFAVFIGHDTGGTKMVFQYVIDLVTRFIINSHRTRGGIVGGRFCDTLAKPNAQCSAGLGNPRRTHRGGVRRPPPNMRRILRPCASRSNELLLEKVKCASRVQLYFMVTSRYAPTFLPELLKTPMTVMRKVMGLAVM